MSIRSHFPNSSSRSVVRFFGNDFARQVLETGTMASRTKGKTKSRGFAREWLELAGLKQADLVKKLDWSKAKANAVWHGEQRLNEDVLEEIAPLVNARTYELLMSPDTAMQFRRLSAALTAAIQPAETPEPAAPPIAHRKAS